MGILSPQTKHTANIPTLMLFQNGSFSLFQNGSFTVLQQWVQAIINVFTKD